MTGLPVESCWSCPLQPLLLLSEMGRESALGISSEDISPPRFFQLKLEVLLIQLTSFPLAGPSLPIWLDALPMVLASFCTLRGSNRLQINFRLLLGHPRHTLCKRLSCASLWLRGVFFFFFFFAWYWPSSLQRRGNINSISKTWRMCWLRKMALYWVRELGILEPVEKVGAQGCIVKGEQSLWVDCVLLTRRCGEWKWPWSKWLFATVLPFSAVNSQILSFLLSMGKVVSTDSSPTFWFLSTPDLHGKLPLLTYLLCLHLCTSLQYFLAEWKNSPPFHP